MLRQLAIAAGLAGLAGCQHIELQNHTMRQAGTLSQMQYRQVLGNIAMFSDNPDSLPYFAVVGTGQTNITDGLSVSDALSWDKVFSMGKFFGYRFDKFGSTIGGTSTAGEQ